MTMLIPPTDEFLDLMYELAEDRILPERHARLEELLWANPDNRQHYVDFMLLVAGLHQTRGEGKVASDEGREIQKAEKVASGQWSVASETMPKPSLSTNHYPLATTSTPFPTIVLDDSSLPSSLSPHPFYVAHPFVFSNLFALLIMGFGVLGAWIYQIDIPRSVAHVARSSSSNKTIAANRPKCGYVGRITGMMDCRGQKVFANQIQVLTTPLLQSSLALGDQFALTSGFLEITYDTGARVILQGPCRYEVESRDSGYLSLGKLTARLEKRGESKGSGGRGQGSGKVAGGQTLVASGQWPVASEADAKSQNPKIPKSPIPNPQSLIPNPLPSPVPTFTVRTPSATVTDLGTEFAVEVENKETSNVYVFAGSVNVTDLHHSEGQLAQAGEAVYVDKHARRRVKLTRLPNQFVREIHPPILFSDDFNGDSFDPTKWIIKTNWSIGDTPIVPLGKVSVEQRDGRAILKNRGYLITKNQFDPDRLGGIVITGQWTYDVTNDALQVLTRSDGVPGDGYGETANGLEFKYWNVTDRKGQLAIEVKGDKLQIADMKTKGSIYLYPGITFNFKIVDNGDKGLSFTLSGISNPYNTATVTARLVSDTTTSKHIVFHNREYEGIDNVAYLDNVTITPNAPVVVPNDSPAGQGRKGGSSRD